MCLWQYFWVTFSMSQCLPRCNLELNSNSWSAFCTTKHFIACTCSNTTKKKKKTTFIPMWMSFYLFFSLQWSMNSAVNPCKLILPNAAQGNEASVLVQDVLLFATHLLLPAKKKTQHGFNADQLHTNTWMHVLVLRFFNLYKKNSLKIKYKKPL